MSPPATDAPVSPLAQRLADEIRQRIAGGALPQGAELSERPLAADLRVSRTPLRRALELLSQNGLLARAPGGSFIVAAAGSAAEASPAPCGPEDQALYARLVDDRLNGVLKDRVTENELVRRYGVRRAQLTRLLARVAAEGWMERLPGHGWAFRPSLTSLSAYRDSYRFRLTLEPAALLEPGYVVDHDLLAERRREQLELAQGAIFHLSDAEIYRRNSQLHETLVGFCQNSFFVEALARVNRLRQVMEYRQKLDRAAALPRVAEHLQLIDMVAAGRTTEAARFLRNHLGELTDIKPRPRLRQVG